MDVHPPYVPPAPYLKEFCPDFSRRKAYNLSSKRLARRDDLTPSEQESVANLYDACIKHVDNGVGEFLDQLQKIKADEDTVVVVTSDHGDELGEHSRGDFILYEGNLRVSLIIQHPKIGEGIVVKPQVSMIDLAPTIIDLVGGDRMPDFYGKSLLPVVNSEVAGPEHIISMNLDLSSEAKCFSCRTEEWKLIVTDGERDRLYNLQDDPGETVNLVDEERVIAERLRAKISDYISFIEKEKQQPSTDRLRQRIKALKQAGKI